MSETTKLLRAVKGRLEGERIRLQEHRPNSLAGVHIACAIENIDAEIAREVEDENVVVASVDALLTVRWDRREGKPAGPVEINVSAVYPTLVTREGNDAPSLTTDERSGWREFLGALSGKGEPPTILLVPPEDLKVAPEE